MKILKVLFTFMAWVNRNDNGADGDGFVLD